MPPKAYCRPTTRAAAAAKAKAKAEEAQTKSKKNKTSSRGKPTKNQKPQRKRTRDSSSLSSSSSPSSSSSTNVPVNSSKARRSAFSKNLEKKIEKEGKVRATTVEKKSKTIKRTSSTSSDTSDRSSSDTDDSRSRIRGRGRGRGGRGGNGNGGRGLQKLAKHEAPIDTIRSSKKGDFLRKTKNVSRGPQNRRLKRKRSNSSSIRSSQSEKNSNNISHTESKSDTDDNDDTEDRDHNGRKNLKHDWERNSSKLEEIGEDGNSSSSDGFFTPVEVPVTQTQVAAANAPRTPPPPSFLSSAPQNYQNNRNLQKGEKNVYENAGGESPGRLTASSGSRENRSLSFRDGSGTSNNNNNNANSNKSPPAPPSATVIHPSSSFAVSPSSTVWPPLAAPLFSTSSASPVGNSPMPRVPSTTATAIAAEKAEEGTPGFRHRHSGGTDTNVCAEWLMDRRSISCDPLPSSTPNFQTVAKNLLAEKEEEDDDDDDGVEWFPAVSQRPTALPPQLPGNESKNLNDTKMRAPQSRFYNHGVERTHTLPPNHPTLIPHPPARTPTQNGNEDDEDDEDVVLLSSTPPLSSTQEASGTPQRHADHDGETQRMSGGSTAAAAATALSSNGSVPTSQRPSAQLISRAAAQRPTASPATMWISIDDSNSDSDGEVELLEMEDGNHHVGRRDTRQDTDTGKRLADGGSLPADHFPDHPFNFQRGGSQQLLQQQQRAGAAPSDGTVGKSAAPCTPPSGVLRPQCLSPGVVEVLPTTPSRSLSQSRANPKDLLPSSFPPSPSSLHPRAMPPSSSAASSASQSMSTFDLHRATPPALYTSSKKEGDAMMGGSGTAATKQQQQNRHEEMKLESGPQSARTRVPRGASSSSSFVSLQDRIARTVEKVDVRVENDGDGAAAPWKGDERDGYESQQQKRPSVSQELVKSGASLAAIKRECATSDADAGRPTFRPRKGALHPTTTAPRTSSPVPIGYLLMDDDDEDEDDDAEKERKRREDAGDHHSSSSQLETSTWPSRVGSPDASPVGSPVSPMNATLPYVDSKHQLYILNDDEDEDEDDEDEVNRSTPKRMSDPTSSGGDDNADEVERGKSIKKLKSQAKMPVTSDDEQLVSRRTSSVQDILFLASRRKSSDAVVTLIGKEGVGIISAAPSNVDPPRAAAAMDTRGSNMDRFRTYALNATVSDASQSRAPNTASITTAAPSRARGRTTAKNDDNEDEVGHDTRPVVAALHSLYPSRFTKKGYMEAVERVVTTPHCLETGEFWDAFESAEYAGEGSFGIVWKCRTVRGDYVAVKSCPVSFASRAAIDDAYSILREIATMRFLNEHNVPYVLPLHSSFFVTAPEALPPPVWQALLWKRRLQDAIDTAESRRRKELARELARRQREKKRKERARCETAAKKNHAKQKVVPHRNGGKTRAAALKKLSAVPNRGRGSGRGRGRGGRSKQQELGTESEDDEEDGEAEEDDEEPLPRELTDAAYVREQAQMKCVPRTDEQMRQKRFFDSVKLPKFLSISELDVLESDATAFLVTELCDKDLEREARLESITKGAAFCVSSALAEMHRLGLLHLDLKPSNILVAYDKRSSSPSASTTHGFSGNESPSSVAARAESATTMGTTNPSPSLLPPPPPPTRRVKPPSTAMKFYLSDFGNCQIVGPGYLEEVHDAIGTYEYMDTRALHDKVCSRPTDCYSLGATLYEMLTCHRLYPPCRNPDCLRNSNNNGDEVEEEEDDNHTRQCYVWASKQRVEMPTSTTLQRITASLLHANPKQRMTAAGCRAALLSEVEVIKPS